MRLNIVLVVVIAILFGGGAGYFGGRLSNTVQVEGGQAEGSQPAVVSPANNPSPAQNYDADLAAEKERELRDRLNCLSAKAAGKNFYRTESGAPAQIYSWTC